MSSFRIVNTYPHPIDKVWAALTDPELIPLWTVTGQGAHPEGFAPTVGTHFRYLGKPLPGWDGVVHCEVLAVDAPRFLKYSWANHPDDVPTIVTYELTSTTDRHTTLVYDHTGFKGPGGLFISKLLARVRRKMLTKGRPPSSMTSPTPEPCAPTAPCDRSRSEPSRSNGQVTLTRRTYRTFSAQHSGRLKRRNHRGPEPRTQPRGTFAAREL